jgi:hypothetical protein
MVFGAAFLPVSARAAEASAASAKADFRFWKRWLLASSLLIGATVARAAHETDEGSRHATTLGPSAVFALAFGYAGDTFHAGLVTTDDLESSKAGPIEEGIIRTAVAMLVGGEVLRRGFEPSVASLQRGRGVALESRATGRLAV